ncbi:MAG: FHA domain-containing protein [Lachnospiraceae bacterium]|nr:FHA domain-containing protein [Lachnospiraceae bacterium]
MKEQLKRELNKTYLILSSEDKQYEESYEIEMIIKNAPETLLPLHVLRMDGELQLFYDISAKQTLKDCTGRAKLSAGTIRALFETLDQLIKEMKDYLLDMESVVLNLEHIYTKEGRFYFCYCPWEKQEILTSFRGMLEEILGDLDYHDTEGVELAYHLYQSACRGDFHISQILAEHCLEKEKVLEETDSVEERLLEEEVFSNTFSEARKLEAELGEEKQKQGFLRRIVQFFMKKEKLEPEKKEEHSFVCESYAGTYYENPMELSYTQVLEDVEENTTLLENMPVGRWKLRPLLPGYEEFCITGESFLVGKKKDEVDGYIGRDTISRIHSRLYIKQERLFIADANSTNGTFVNDIAIAPGKDVEIFAGDRILFADVGYECYNSL